MNDEDQTKIPPTKADPNELTEEEAASASGGMDVRIEKVDSKVSTTDSGGTLSAGVIDRIVKTITKGLKH